MRDLVERVIPTRDVLVVVIINASANAVVVACDQDAINTLDDGSTEVGSVAMQTPEAQLSMVVDTHRETHGAIPKDVNAQTIVHLKDHTGRINRLPPLLPKTRQGVMRLPISRRDPFELIALMLLNMSISPDN
jgi:hypothetical protein